MSETDYVAEIASLQARVSVLEGEVNRLRGLPIDVASINTKLDMVLTAIGGPKQAVTHTSTAATAGGIVAFAEIAKWVVSTFIHHGG